MTETDERPVRKLISKDLVQTAEKITSLFLNHEYSHWEDSVPVEVDIRPFKSLPGNLKLRRILMGYTHRIENLTTEETKNRPFYFDKPKGTETYRIEVICNNCAQFQHDADKTIGFAIPKGTAAGIFLRDKICNNCGLTGTLRRKFYPEPFLQE